MGTMYKSSTIITIEFFRRTRASKETNFFSQLHAAALSSLRSEVAELNSRLLVATRARETAEAALMRAEVQAVRAEQRAEQQAVRHEERLTELHSVIAELGRQLERHRATVIAEEDESGKGPVSPPPPCPRVRTRGGVSRYRVPISPSGAEGALASLGNECHGQFPGGQSLQTPTITIAIAPPVPPFSIPRTRVISYGRRRIPSRTLSRETIAYSE